MEADLKALKARDEKARRIEVVEGAVTFVLRRPTRHQMTILLSSSDVDGEFNALAFAGNSVRNALTDVVGLKYGDLFPEEDTVEMREMAVPFDRELVTTYIQERPELLKRISTEIWERVEAVKKNMAATQKNLVCVSPDS